MVKGILLIFLGVGIVASITLYIATYNYLMSLGVRVGSGSTDVSLVPVPSAATVRGRVLLSPVCPVERIPPDPNCAPKGYPSALLHVFKSSDTAMAEPFMTSKTDANGAFAFSLPEGNYVLHVAVTSVMPRCADKAVVVQGSGAQDVTVDCDTGIR